MNGDDCSYDFTAAFPVGSSNDKTIVVDATHGMISLELFDKNNPGCKYRVINFLPSTKEEAGAMAQAFRVCARHLEKVYGVKR